MKKRYCWICWRQIYYDKCPYHKELEKEKIKKELEDLKKEIKDKPPTIK